MGKNGPKPAAESFLAFDLPWPPLLNKRKTLNRQGRLVQPQAIQDYYAAAGREMIAQGLARQNWPLLGAVSVGLMAYAPATVRTYDIDAPIKVVLDCLQYNGVLKNDAQILSLSITKGPPERGGRLRVTLMTGGV